MFRRKEKPLAPRTPSWFKSWHSEYFQPIKAKSARNEKLIYILLASVLTLNTVGNYYHVEIFDFIVNLWWW